MALLVPKLALIPVLAVSALMAAASAVKSLVVAILAEIFTAVPTVVPALRDCKPKVTVPEPTLDKVIELVAVAVTPVVAEAPLMVAAMVNAEALAATANPLTVPKEPATLRFWATTSLGSAAVAVGVNPPIFALELARASPMSAARAAVMLISMV